MKLAAIFPKIGFFLFLTLVFLTPLFFLPFTPDFYEFPKHFLIIVVSLVSLLLLGLTFVTERQVRLTFSPFSLPVLTLITSFILSTFFKAPNRLDTFLDPGQTGTYLALGLLFFCAVNFIRTKKEVDLLAHAFTGSVALLSLITIIWSSGLAPKIPLISSIQYLTSNVWSPTGLPLPALSVFIAALVFLAVQLLKEKNLHPKSVLLAVSFALTLVATGILSYRLFASPDNSSRPVFLSHRASWAIALEALKISPLLGVGPGSYPAAFTQFRPISFNLTPQWALRFPTGSNSPLHLLTTIGALGLIAYLFLALRTYTTLIKTATSPSNISLAALTAVLAIFATQLFLPSYLVSTAALFFLLILAVSALKTTGSSLIHESNIDIVAASSSGNSPILPIISLTLITILVAPGLYFVTRAYAAEARFQKALQFAAANDGKNTYDTLISAIATNPYRDTYRIAYSQTNLLIANSLAANPTPAGLTDADRNTITQLVQQAIREAKNAAALNPTKVANLENLAGIYRNLLNFAQGADAWTLASYRQAIILDPVNPNLRIALGGVYFAQKNWDEAIRWFQTAADLKPDLANAHYNLSAALREKGELLRAVSSLETTINLLDKSSADYTKASGELADLRQKIGETTPLATPASSQLTQPEPLPTPKVNPPLELDQSLSPEAPSTPPTSPQP